MFCCKTKVSAVLDRQLRSWVIANYGTQCGLYRIASLLTHGNLFVSHGVINKITVVNSVHPYRRERQRVSTALRR